MFALSPRRRLSIPGLPAPGAVSPDALSIVTIFDPDRAAPAWETLFGWPSAQVAAVPLTVGSAGDRKRWAARLDGAVRQADRAVLLVADGLGCAASAWWARLSPRDDVARVAGALLFAPGDGAADAGRDALFASPRTTLPFPSLVIRPDRAVAPARAAVEQWGSRVVFAARTRPGAGGVGAWSHAQRLFLRLASHVADHEVGRAEALLGRRSPDR